MIHNDDPLNIPFVPPPPLIGVSNDRVHGANGYTLLQANGEDLALGTYVKSNCFFFGQNSYVTQTLSLVGGG